MSFHVCNHPAEWSGFLAHAHCPHLLQSWGWGDLKSQFGWQAVRLIVDHEGHPVAGVQVLFRKAGPLSIGYIPKGPLFLQETDETRSLLLQALHTTARQMRAISLKIEPNTLDAERTTWDWLEAAGFVPNAQEIQPRRTIVIDVSYEPEEILASFKSKWRYNTRLSAKRGVEVRRQGAEALDAFYQIMQVTGERDEFGIHSQAYYTQAFEEFEREGQAVLIMAYLEEKPIAGIMVPAFGEEAIYMYGGSLNEHRELMPNHQLQYEAMVWAHEQGCTRYDLWGIPDVDIDAEEHDLGGVGRFKAGFGGWTERYAGAYEYIYRPAVDKLIKAAISLRKRLH